MQETQVPSLGQEDPEKDLPSWRRKWQPALVFLPGKSHGWWNLMGYSPWGHKRVWHNLAPNNHPNQFPFWWSIPICSTFLICYWTYKDYIQGTVPLTVSLKLRILSGLSELTGPWDGKVQAARPLEPGMGCTGSGSAARSVQTSGFGDGLMLLVSKFGRDSFRWKTCSLRKIIICRIYSPKWTQVLLLDEFQSFVCLLFLVLQCLEMAKSGIHWAPVLYLGGLRSQEWETGSPLSLVEEWQGGVAGRAGTVPRASGW